MTADARVAVRLKRALLAAELGRFEEALTAFAAFSGDELAMFPEAGRQLASLVSRSERPEFAEMILRQALAENPKSDHLRSVLAAVLLRLERSAEAIKLLREIEGDLRDDPSVLTNLGTALWRTGELGEALACHARALSQAPGDREVGLNASTAFMAAGQDQLAETILRGMLAHHPLDPELLSNLGIVLRHQGRLDEAIEVQRRARSLCPDRIEFSWNLGITLLAAGNYLEGWAEFDRRWSARAQPPGEPPLWDGGPLENQTLMLFQEQGFGDAIQFGRFAPPLAAAGTRVVARVEAPLVRLFSAAGCFHQVVASSASPPAHDARLSLMSLPRVLGTTLASLPSERWLKVDRADVALWKDRLPPGSGPLVGLVWAGNPNHRGDRFRSLPLAVLRPLLETAGARFVSLQVGEARGQIAGLPEELRPADLGAMVKDFADTAALLANLDVLVTCDSAPAHLAGSLGIPTWLALPAVPDWRWLVDREDSPWYASLRLFRQAHLGDWGDVVGLLVAELEAMIARGWGCNAWA